MTAYGIGYLQIWDDSWTAEYVPRTTAIIERHGGRILSARGRMEVLEGDPKLPSAFIILEFPSAEQARAWYNDPEYAPLRTLRQTGSKLDLVLVDNSPSG